jgi:hypothetical protein
MKDPMSGGAVDLSARAVNDLRTLYQRLTNGDAGVIAAFGAKAIVDSPYGGKQQPSEFIAETHAWLERHRARAEDIHTLATPERVIHELTLYLEMDDGDCELPVMLVADVEDDCIRDLRVYHSTWPLTGSHLVRRPLMQYRLTERPAEPVGTYHDALGEGDAEKADATFEPAGCVREPAGGPYVYCASARAEWYRLILSQGPIVLHLATITDDGETVVYEYMADRWGSEPMTPQAGAASYQRGASGKIAWARIYDDIRPPASLGG